MIEVDRQAYQHCGGISAAMAALPISRDLWTPKTKNKINKKRIFFLTNGLHQWILRPKTDKNAWFHKIWSSFNFGGIGGWLGGTGRHKAADGG